MDQSQLSINDIRDHIADWEGWTKHRSVGYTKEDGDAGVYWRKGDQVTWGHPVPYTLTEAAKMPKGERWAIRIQLWYGTGRWTAYGKRFRDGWFTEPSGDNEIDARFRLRYAATLASRQ